MPKSNRPPPKQVDDEVNIPSEKGHRRNRITNGQKIIRLRKMIRTGYRKSLEALLGPPRGEKKKLVSSTTTTVNASKKRKTDVNAATSSSNAAPAASTLRETIKNIQENDKENTSCNQIINSEQKDKKERPKIFKNDGKFGNEEEERSPLLLSLSSSTLSPSLPSKPILQLPAAAAAAAPSRRNRMEIEIDNEINVLGVDDGDEDEPHVLNEETQREHSYCDDARNRGVWEERGGERLPFGFFAGCGEGNEIGTICRNS